MTQVYRRESKLTEIERTGRPIWQTPFLCSVPYKDSMSPDYKRLFGMPTVGDAAIDKEMHDQPFTTYITVNAMIEYFKKGITVTVNNHADTKVIYDIINNYLLAWKKQLEHGINIGGAPIEDLIEMDRFAMVVFPHASQHFTSEWMNSRFVDGITGGGTYMTRSSLVKNEAKPVEEQAPEEHKRESMAQLFSERVMGLVGTRAAPVNAAPVIPATAAPRWKRGRG